MQELILAAAIVFAAGFAKAQSIETTITGDQAKAEFTVLNQRLQSGDSSIQFVNTMDVVEISDAKELCRLEGAHAESAQARGGETYTCWITK